MKEIIQYITVGVGSLIAYLIGDYDTFLYALIIFMSADYVTGLMIALNNKKLSSKVGFKGTTKKCTILVMVVIANIIDVNLLQEGNVIRTAVILFYLSNEGISLLENASKLGVPIPKKLLKVLQQLSDEEVVESEDK